MRMMVVNPITIMGFSLMIMGISAPHVIDFVPDTLGGIVNGFGLAIFIFSHKINPMTA